LASKVDKTIKLSAIDPFVLLAMVETFNGVVYHSADQELVHLLLEHVVVKVLICDGKANHGPLNTLAQQTDIFVLFTVSARVVLTQTYTNTSDTPTTRAKYVFPVPSRAAVCAFEMNADGHVIVGVSKEKSKAAEEHEAAIREGKFTGLLEWVTDDGQCSSRMYDRPFNCRMNFSLYNLRWINSCDAKCQNNTSRTS
jgi:hypothetical protein